MQDTSHLVAIQERLIRERRRLAEATKPGEIAQRTVWVAQCEKELADEYDFLGMPSMNEPLEMSDAELLAALRAA